MRHRSSTILLALLMASLAPSLLAGQSLDLSGSAFAADYLVKLIEPDAFFKPLSPPRLRSGRRAGHGPPGLGPG